MDFRDAGAWNRRRQLREDVFVGSNDGRFYVLNLTDGAKLWEFDTGAPLSASPAIANGRIIIGSQDGRLYCFG